VKHEINRNMKVRLSINLWKYTIIYKKNVAFYDILYLLLYYRPIDRELSRNFLVDRRQRQVGHPWAKP